MADVEPHLSANHKKNFEREKLFFHHLSLDLIIKDDRWQVKNTTAMHKPIFKDY